MADFGTALATGIAAWQVTPPSTPPVFIVYLTEKNCNMNTALAFLADLSPSPPAWAPPPNPLLMDGVPVPAGPDNIAVIVQFGVGPYTGSVDAFQSAVIITAPWYETPGPIDWADSQYLACGNADGTPVTGWDGLLGPDLRLKPIPTAIPTATPTVTPTPAPALSLDTDIASPGIQASRILDTYGNFQVAVVIENPGRAVGSFQLELVYDPARILGVEVVDIAPALDDNPDANAGGTTWPTTQGDDLGGDWDCSVFGEAYPVAGGGRAKIGCMSLTGPYTLGDDETEGILAVVMFQPLAITETDTWLSLENVIIGDSANQEMGSCNPVNVVGISCNSASVRALEDGDGIPFGMDNCPTAYNPDQTNTPLGPIDNGPDITGNDITNPYEDAVGDACDDDADNDGLPDSQEYDDDCPYRLARDSDGDGSLDGYEMSHSADPCSAASKPLPGSSNDSDGDGFTDDVEVRGWGTNPYSRDSDSDSCDDDKEIASINADKQANLLDVMWVAKMAFGITPPHPALDLDKSGGVNILDALLAAKNSTLVESHNPCP